MSSSSTKVGSRGAAIVAVAIVLTLLQCANIVAGTGRTFVVGDDLGWNYILDMETWPEGKQFFVGDILEFNYDYQMRDVVVVDQEGHDTCTVTRGAVVYESGHDQIPLNFGANYFISNVFDECSGGLKMAINATLPPPPPPHQP